MSVIDDLVPLLKNLRLSGVLQSLELRLREAADDSLSYQEFLYRLMKDEVERRDGKQLDQRVRRANFEHQKTLEDFDFHFNPQVPKAKVLDLATCTYVERRENVLLLGPTRVGKSHIAQALGYRACRAGFSVLYASAQDVLKQLHVSRADNMHDKKLARFTDVDLLIVDDLGLRPLKGDERIDLYEIVRLRYERGSTVITSNRDTDELHHSSVTHCWPAPPWIACCTVPTSCGWSATPIEIHPLTGAPNAGTIKQWRQPHEPHQAAYGSAWPICPRLDAQGLRALPDGRDHRIRLADPGAVH